MSTVTPTFLTPTYPTYPTQPTYPTYPTQPTYPTYPGYGGDQWGGTIAQLQTQVMQLQYTLQSAGSNAYGNATYRMQVDALLTNVQRYQAALGNTAYNPAAAQYAATLNDLANRLNQLRAIVYANPTYPTYPTYPTTPTYPTYPTQPTYPGYPNAQQPPVVIIRRPRHHHRRHWQMQQPYQGQYPYGQYQQNNPLGAIVNLIGQLGGQQQPRL